ncbi:MAG: hypothetical protein KGJ13_09830 [Patescibacteria group bacterium]|nr:hypothetical protein [Patescibacteria group bacterium]
MKEREKQRIYSALRYRAHVYQVSEEALIDLYDFQKGLCAICEKELTEKGMYVDHNHHIREKWKAVRGLLCIRCNTGIGMIEKNMGAAVAYVTKPPAHVAPLLSEERKGKRKNFGKWLKAVAKYKAVYTIDGQPLAAKIEDHTI